MWKYISKSYTCNYRRSNKKHALSLTNNTDKVKKLTLSSNSTYLNEERVKKLVKSNLTTLLISLDNSNPEKHNGIRSYNETFDDVMNAIKLCRNNKF